MSKREMKRRKSNRVTLCVEFLPFDPSLSFTKDNNIRLRSNMFLVKMKSGATGLQTADKLLFDDEF